MSHGYWLQAAVATTFTAFPGFKTALLQTLERSVWDEGASGWPPAGASLVHGYKMNDKKS